MPVDSKFDTRSGIFFSAGLYSYPEAGVGRGGGAYEKGSWEMSRKQRLRFRSRAYTSNILLNPSEQELTHPLAICKCQLRLRFP